MANIINEIKLSGITYQIEDSGALRTLDDSVTSGGTNAVKGSGVYNAITASTAALAEAIGEEMSAKTDVSAFTAHTSDTVSHTTQAEKDAWNAKLDSADVASLFGNVAYDSSSKRINFYHETTSGTVLAYVDATDFVKDGFLSSVTIDNRTISGESVPCLVFVWNTDSGIQETDIPLTGIFDPSNYYQKSEVDNAISAATSGKQDTLIEGTGIDITDNTISVTGIPNVDQTVISGSTNPVAGGAVYDELQGKQDTLVNQTNIKSINNESLLGSGNISTLQATVSGSTLILS